MLQFLSFKGRTSRKSCWIGGLIIVVIAFAAFAVGGLAARVGYNLTKFYDGLVLTYIASFFLLPLLPLYARRLHDRDRTALWLLIGPLLIFSYLFVAPIVGNLINPTDVPPPVMRAPLYFFKKALAESVVGAPFAWLIYVPDCFRITATTTWVSQRYLFGALGIVSLIYGIWLIIELAVRRGTVGPNKYGPDPLQ